MIHDNPHCKKIRRSQLLLVSCGYCKGDLVIYQKVGKGRLLRMYIERIVKSSVDLSADPQALYCPNCRKQVATKVILKRKKTEAYALIRSAYNVKKITS